LELGIAKIAKLPNLYQILTQLFTIKCFNGGAYSHLGCLKKISKIYKNSANIASYLLTRNQTSCSVWDRGWAIAIIRSFWVLALASP
jgi:hypothetical protein